MGDRHLLGRRQFIITSSACAVAAATVGPRLFASQPEGVPKRLAVGFWAGDARAALQAAADVPSGDGAFLSRGVRISVSGASGVSGTPSDRRAVELLADYTYADGAQPGVASYLAWGASRTSRSQGYPVSFVVPVDVTQTIALRVAVEQGRQSGTPTSRRRAVGPAVSKADLPVALSLLSESPLKLARGYYVLVPLYESESEPRWSRFGLKMLDGRWALHDADGNVAPFEHFVLRIDYAT